MQAMSFSKVVVRNTFIDIEETTDRTGPHRSRSAPPKAATSGVRDPIESTWAQWVESWTESASHLSQKNFNQTVDSKDSTSEGTLRMVPPEGEEASTSAGDSEPQSKKKPGSFNVLDEDSNEKDGNERMKFHDNKIPQCGGEEHPSPKGKRGVPLPDESIPSQSPSDEDPSSTLEITTLMIGNIPVQFKIESILDAIKQLGFADAYDLVYMPSQYNRQGGKPFGHFNYAFVNFRKSEDAAAFVKEFRNFRIQSATSKARRLYIKAAACQGFEANVRTYKSRRSSGYLVTCAKNGSLNGACN
jgi:RNA recognition motif-containing protein